MPQFRAPRGTRDLLPDEAARFARFAEVARSLTERYGYRPIETPVFEQADVFERGIGEVTDVVEKELFRIAPRTEESEAWALRPEPTAGIVRAYVQHGMQTWPQPVRLTTTGPMFRYDRPQAGRYRQFWQFDVEAIGDPRPPSAALRRHLYALAIPYRIEPGLVRGLDYYTRTAIEFYVAGREGQQQALGGGGRYDGLVELLGGRPTPGIGFALGLDRVALVLDEQAVAEPAGHDAPDAVVVSADPDDTVSRLRIATDLRSVGLRARADLGHRKLGRQLEAASRDGAHFAVILGDELAEGQVQLRDLEAGTQQAVATTDLARALERG